MEVGEKGTCSMRKVAKSLNIFSTFFKGKMHTKMDHFLKKQEFKKFHSTVLNFYFIFWYHRFNGNKIHLSKKKLTH
jgi:hypothetical protein